MKFLVDVCAGRKLAQWLSEQGHDVIESRDFGIQADDSKILAEANARGCNLITMDKDFGRLLFLEQSEHCGLIRLPDVPVATRIAIMEQALTRHAHDLRDKAIIMVRSGQMRTSKSP